MHTHDEISFSARRVTLREGDLEISSGLEQNTARSEDDNKERTKQGCGDDFSVYWVRISLHLL